MILINPVMFSFARLMAIKTKQKTLADYIENLIYEDIRINDQKLFTSKLDNPNNIQTMTDKMNDLEQEEILPFGLSKTMKGVDHLNEMNLIQSFMDLTEGGSHPEHTYNNKWKDFYCKQLFILEHKVYNKYMLSAKAAGENPRRYLNIIIKEWLEIKRVEKQDRIEREAHGGNVC